VSDGGLVLSGPAGTITLSDTGIEIDSQATLKIESDSGLKMKSGGTLEVNGALVTLGCSGGLPVARVTDIAQGVSAPGGGPVVSTIVKGSPTVRAC
jgi:hypothetical protein